MREKVQAFAGAMMVPIIVLVMVGLFVGIGAAFVNYILPEGTLLWKLFKVIVDMGFMVMSYLPFFFVLGLSFGLAKAEKGWAAFTGFTMLMAFNAIIRTMAGFDGWNADTIIVDNLISNAGMGQLEAQNFNALWGNVAGIFTYNMGIFSGLLIGFMTAMLHNRFYKTELHNYLSFFNGPRFVVIVGFAAVIPVGVISYYVWPVVAGGLQSVTLLITDSGLYGSFLYGILDKALLPFGLHHLVSFPLEYTRVGGVMEVDGMMIEGVRNIMLAQSKSPDATGYITHNFTTGRILIQFGGIPGAAYAMYKTAKPENRKKVAALLLPAALTAPIVGITEPFEYTFLFIQPLLFFAIHVPLTGLSFVLAEMTNVSILGNQLIFMVPNLFQPHKVHALSLIYLIPLYFVIYFYAFKFAILKWNAKTPGREDDGDDVALFTKKDYIAKNKGQSGEAQAAGGGQAPDLADEIIFALGGAENIDNVSNCATRLRVSLLDESKVTKSDDEWKSQLNALGVVRVKKGIQVIYGTSVITIAGRVKERLGIA